MIVFVETQDGIPYCVDVVYVVDVNTIKLDHLLQFDGTGDVVDEENKKAGSALISVVLTASRSSCTSRLPDPRTR